MTWFAKASTNIPNLHLVVANDSFIMGLYSETFLDFLYTNPSANMDALLARTTRYINIEENSKVRKRVKTQPTMPTPNNQTFNKRRVGKYENYTPLKVR